MANPYFQFKRFVIWHDKCAMKVGTDGVLLGAWCSVEKAHHVLDIGTGTGLVALMLAQRSNNDCHIVALEIDAEAALQAQENVNRTEWKDRITVVQGDFNEYLSVEKFDTIVSNPPYFVDALTCPSNQRKIARHNCTLNYETLLAGVAKLLTENGTFTIVIPTDVLQMVKEIASRHHLYAKKQLNVITKPGAAPKRTLIAFSFGIQICEEEDLLTEIARHQYSEAYIKLTRDFYLKM